MRTEIKSCFKPVVKPSLVGQRIMEAHIGLFGDLVCWNCNVNIIVPGGYVLQEGWNRCPICRARFRVTQDVADLVNTHLGPTPNL
jgi:hypothetical protein